MRKFLPLLLAAIAIIYSNFAAGQNSLTDRSMLVDSATMLRRAHRRVDSLSLLIPKTVAPIPLAALYVNRGIGQGILNHPDSAVHDYSMALLLNSGLKEVYPLRAMQYQRMNNYQAGIVDDEKALTLFNDNPTRLAALYASIGFMQLRLKNFDKALKADSASLAINPNNGFVYQNNAIIYMRLKNYDKAIENLDACLPLQKARGEKALSDILAGRGDAKLSLKKYKDAINDYLSALRLNPDNKFALWNLAVAYNSNSDYELSAAAYGKTILYYSGDDKSLAELYTNKSREEIAMQKVREALHDDSLALTHNSQYAPAFWNMAYVYSQNGDIEQSLDWYRKTLKYYNDPKDQSLLNDAIAENASFLAHYDEVVEATTKAIELDARAWSPHLNRGRAYLKQGKNAQAMDDFNKVLALDTTKKSYEYAFALFYTGNNDKAIQLMQNNIVNTGDVSLLVNHYYNLACLYSLMNKPDEANIYLKKCIDGGYSKRYAQLDPDLENIRGTADFKAMIDLK